MATLRIKRRRNATETIDTETETQAKDRTTVNREIILSAAAKVITSNEIMETPTVVKVEVTVVTQEADPVTITAKGEETKTETGTTTDKIDTDKTIKTKTMATPNADITPATKGDAENETHQIDTDNESNDGQDTYISNQSNDNASDNEFYFADKKFHDTNKTNDKKENDEPVEDTDDESMISYAAEDNEDTELMIEKTYQDALIPLQGELLNTEIIEPTVTLIPKQEIDYRPEIVLAIPKDPQAK
jgi:hypothetical protein